MVNAQKNKASEQKRDIFSFFKENADRIFDNRALLRQVNELVGLFGKVLRGYRLYPATNPSFDKFAAQFTSKLEDILVDLPSISLRITPKGFMLRDHLIESGEKDQEIVFFLYNDGLREIFFQQGTEKSEVKELFDCLAKCTIFASEDYDLTTLLWDCNFSNIGYITEDELVSTIITDEPNHVFSPFSEDELSYGPGSNGYGMLENTGAGLGGNNNINSTSTSIEFDISLFEKYSQLVFKENRSVDVEQRKEALNKIFATYVVGKMEIAKFDDALKKNSDNFVVQRFLKELSDRLIKTQGTPAGDEILEISASIWQRLVLFGAISGAILFIKTLSSLAEKLGGSKPEYAKKIQNSFKTLGDDEFLNDLFFLIEDMPEEEVKAIGELFTMIPEDKVGLLLSKINDINSKDTRLAILKSLAKSIPISDSLIALTQNEDWKIVRNALFLMKEKKDPRVLPAIRATISHPKDQARVEALALLTEFSVEEALPALEKAVFSTARDAREAAIHKILEFQNSSIVPIINRVMQPNSLKKFDDDEIDEIFMLIITLKRQDLYSLIGHLMVSADPVLRGKAMRAISRASILEGFGKSIAKAVEIGFFSKLKPDEQSMICSMIKPEVFSDLTGSLDGMLNVSGNIFNRSVTRAKELIFSAVFALRKLPEVQRFIDKAERSGNSETVKIVNKMKERYI